MNPQEQQPQPGPQDGQQQSAPAPEAVNVPAAGAPEQDLPPTPGQAAPAQVGQPPVEAGQPQPPAPQGKKGKKDDGGVTTTKVQSTNPNSTQNTLQMKEIRDGMAIMADGSMRAAIACQSINFDLMSSGEREGVEYAYQNLLNSLYFPAQILIRSQRVDIRPYLEHLSKLRRDQDNMLLGMLMEDYIDFIAQISEETNIMDKQFYIVVPYYPTGDPTSAVTSSKNLFAGLFSGGQQAIVHINPKTYQKAKDEIQNRVSTVINGLMQMGVQATRLNTKQYSELLYNYYNPDTAVREPIGNFDPQPTVAVRKGQGEAAQPQLDKELM